MTESIILQNLSPEGLKDLFKEAVKEVIEAAVKPPDKFLSRREAAEKLGICLPTIDKMIKRGAFPSYRIEGRVVLKESELKPPIRNNNKVG